MTKQETTPMAPEAPVDQAQAAGAAGATPAAAVEDAAVVVVGGGPAGATAAETLARLGVEVLLLDREDRIKPCGGAIPPRAVRDFSIPDSVLCARVTSARMVGPNDQPVDMPIHNKPGHGAFVGMVDRKTFDPWLRARAAEVGAGRRCGTCVRLEPEDGPGGARTRVVYRDRDSGAERVVRARAVIGADGANSRIARQIRPEETGPCLSAYHEVIRRPASHDRRFDPERCDFYYQGRVSPDYYGWVFPHGDTISVGMGTGIKGVSLRQATATLRAQVGLTEAETLRCEGGALPMWPLKRWDDGRGVVLAGDAAGVVAQASGEGIYYALVSGRLAGEAVAAFLRSGRAADLALARRWFMRDHGFVFLFLRRMQSFWYTNDRRKACFVAACRDPALQRQVWISYLNKVTTTANPWDQMRISAKTMGCLAGFLKP